MRWKENFNLYNYIRMEQAMGPTQAVLHHYFTLLDRQGEIQQVKVNFLLALLGHSLYIG